MDGSVVICDINDDKHYLFSGVLWEAIYMFHSFGNLVVVAFGNFFD